MVVCGTELSTRGGLSDKMGVQTSWWGGGEALLFTQSFHEKKKRQLGWMQKCRASRKDKRKASGARHRAVGGEFKWVVGGKSYWGGKDDLKGT